MLFVSHRADSTPRARHADRFVNKHTKNSRRMLTAITLSVALSATSLPAYAQPTNPDDAHIAQAHNDVDSRSADVASLATSLSQTEADIARLENEMGGLREAVNKALVDLHDAQATAERARQESKAARAELDDTQAKMTKAQATLDEISRTAYRGGGTGAPIGEISGSRNSEDSLDRQTFLRVQTEKQRAAIAELDRLRTEKANNESALREARKIAEQREQEAADAEAHARQAIETNGAALQEKQAHRQQLVERRDSAQSQLDSARGTVSTLEGQRQEYLDYERSKQQRAEAEQQAREATAASDQAQQQAQQARQEATAAAQAAEEATQAAQQATAPQAPATGNEQTTRPEQGPSAQELEQQRRAQEAARKAAEEAAAKKAEAERAEAEAAQRAEAEAQAQQAREAAAAAASVAAAAVIAATAPNHTALDNPYPTDEEAADAVVAAQQQPTAGNDAATGDTVSQTTEGTTDGDNDVIGGLINLLDQITEGTTKAPQTARDITAATTQVVSGSRDEKIEAVINRAMSQLGTPYAWGGGDANGPTLGIRDGGVADAHGDYNKYGFDCSGLVLYAFAAAGISLPHYTGYQYQRGTKVSPSDMQRGDLIFYGPNAENHVAIYLGDGQMIEAPQSGSTVKISPVRWGGMSPYVVRMI